MKTRLEMRDYLTTMLVSIFSGLFVYFMLSYLLIADRVTIPTSFAISILIFGLIEYYSSLRNDSVKRPPGSPALINSHLVTTNQMIKKQYENRLIILFVTIFVVLVIIS